MGGRGSIGGTLIGAFVIGLLVDGLVMVGISSFWQMVVIGVVIVVAVIIDQVTVYASAYCSTATDGRLVTHMD